MSCDVGYYGPGGEWRGLESWGAGLRFVRLRGALLEEVPRAVAIRALARLAAGRPSRARPGPGLPRRRARRPSRSSILKSGYRISRVPVIMSNRSVQTSPQRVPPPKLSSPKKFILQLKTVKNDQKNSNHCESSLKEINMGTKVIEISDETQKDDKSQQKAANNKPKDPPSSEKDAKTTPPESESSKAVSKSTQKVVEVEKEADKENLPRHYDVEVTIEEVAPGASMPELDNGDSSQSEDIDRVRSGCSSPPFLELEISQQDVLLYRRHLAATSAVDLHRFDTDAGYQLALMYRMQPLVRVERLPNARLAATAATAARSATNADSDKNSSRDQKKSGEHEDDVPEPAPPSTKSIGNGSKATKDEAEGKGEGVGVGGTVPKGKGTRAAARHTVPVPKSSSVAPSREYSSFEDQAIVSWLSADVSRERKVNGNQIWKQLQAQYHNITGQRRTWHSLRNRYLRYVLPALGLLALPPDSARRLRANAALGDLKARKVVRRSSMHERAAGARRGGGVLSAWSRRPRERAGQRARPRSRSRSHSKTLKKKEQRKRSRSRSKTKSPKKALRKRSRSRSKDKSPRKSSRKRSRSRSKSKTLKKLRTRSKSRSSSGSSSQFELSKKVPKRSSKRSRSASKVSHTKSPAKRKSEKTPEAKRRKSGESASNIKRTHRSRSRYKGDKKKQSRSSKKRSESGFSSSDSETECDSSECEGAAVGAVSYRALCGRVALLRGNRAPPDNLESAVEGGRAVTRHSFAASLGLAAVAGRAVRPHAHRDTHRHAHRDRPRTRKLFNQ